MQNYNELKELIEGIIKTKREDDWWDFKQYYYEDKASLLHDIICLANNRANKDAYLILGVEDNTFEVVGVENDLKRKNQQNIVDFLRQISFAGQVRPRVEMRTLHINNHEIDVLIIKNSTDVPYYLTKSYVDKKYKPIPPKKGKIVRPFHIYTRVMDNNTPIDDNADIKDVEYLWRKRFGLIQTPLEHIKILLQKPNEWIEEDSRYYHKYFPQYTIVVEHEETEDGLSKEGNKMFYHHLQTDTSAYYGEIKICHYNTQLFSCQSTELDGHRMTAPCPKSEFISYRRFVDPNIHLKYYTVNSLRYLLLKFLEYQIGENNGHEAQIATKRLFDVVLLFDTEDDINNFSIYVKRHLNRFDELVSKQPKHIVLNETQLAADEIEKEIRNSFALKEMHNEWKKIEE